MGAWSYHVNGLISGPLSSLDVADELVEKYLAILAASETDGAISCYYTPAGICTGVSVNSWSFPGFQGDTFTYKNGLANEDMATYASPPCLKGFYELCLQKPQRGKSNPCFVLYAFPASVFRKTPILKKQSPCALPSRVWGPVPE